MAELIQAAQPGFTVGATVVAANVSRALPDQEQMYQALLARDASYEGVFIVAVKTTGIYCRPSCSARKPKRQNVEFYASREEARAAGYRACKICTPDSAAGAEPPWLQLVLQRVDQDLPTRDADLRALGLEPARVRRWFNKHHGLTFQQWCRARRIAAAHTALQGEAAVTDVAMASGFDSLSGFGEAFQKLAGCAPSLGKSSRLIKVKRLLSPLGPMFAAADDDGICLLEFDDRKALDQQLQRLQRVLSARFVAGEHPLFEQLEHQLAEYFAGRLQRFDLPLQLAGTDFQRQAWQALIDIPYGETRSYQAQATDMGKPSAVRAVASANAKNALAIIVPCHRVVGKNGKLTGYAGGLWRKQRLLELETARN